MAGNIVEIKIKDNQDWTSVTGIATNWTNYSKKYKEERVQSWYLSPEVVTDTWNGAESDIQHAQWDVWYFQLFLKESELKFIQQMKSTSDIEIIQYSDDDGTVINTTYTLDTRKTDYINISEPERASDTSGWKVDIIFRTNRTIINKAIPIDNTNYISFQDNIWKNDFLQSIGGRIARLDNSSIAVSGDLKKYTLSGELWSQEGNTLSGTFIEDITGLDSSTVAIVDSSGNLKTYSFDGTDWSQVGNTLALLTIPDVRITALSSTRVAIYKPNTITITTYDFDGTDWSQIGNALTISAGFADIAGMTSSKIALADTDSSELRDYDFDGTDWSVNDVISANISGTYGAVGKLASNRVALISSGDDILESYILDSTWSLESGSLDVVASGFIIDGIDQNTVYLGGTNAGNYSYGIYKYYSDYDVLDWNKPTEDVEVEWFDNTIKKAQKTNKDGFEYVQYIVTSEHDEFIEDLKKAITTTINGTEINEVEFDEPVLIGEGLMKIIVRGVSETTVTTDYLDTNQDFSLSLDDGGGADLFYTDYQVEFISETPEIDQTENQTGIKETSKSISKTVRTMKFYKSEADAFDLKTKFEVYAETGIIEPGTISVLENREVTPTRLGEDLWEVVINCLTGVTSN